MVACARDEEQLALKMVECSNADEEAPCYLEYDRLKKAHACGANVIRVLDGSWCIAREQDESRWAVGYLMQRGTSLEVESVRSQPRIRLQALQAMEQLHAKGWYHGDARVANLVLVERRDMVWVDFLGAHPIDPALKESYAYCRRTDMTKLVTSAYARVRGTQSPNMKLPRSVMNAITAYAQGSANAQAVYKCCEMDLATK